MQLQSIIMPTKSKLIRVLLIPLKLTTVIICCSFYSLLCSCTGVKIPLGSSGAYYESGSVEDLMENHRNPQRMADKLEAERQIETDEAIERQKNKDKFPKDKELNDLIDRNLGRPQ